VVYITHHMPSAYATELAVAALARVFTPAGELLHVAAAAIAQDYPVAIFSSARWRFWAATSAPSTSSSIASSVTVRPGIAERDASYERLAENRGQILQLAGQVAGAREANNGRLGRYQQ
jgi:hypothetical protein